MDLEDGNATLREIQAELASTAQHLLIFPPSRQYQYRTDDVFQGRSGSTTAWLS